MYNLVRHLDKSVYLKIIFSYFSTKTYVVCAQKNRLDETVHPEGSFEHLKHMFKMMDKKIIAILHIYFWLNWPYAH